MVEDVSFVKLEIYAPCDYVEVLLQEMAKIGAGEIGRYDHCCSIVHVKGFWRPQDNANPWQGEKGQLCQGSEVKMEIRCPKHAVRSALKIIRSFHPYEEPVINVVPLLNTWFE